MAEVTKKYAVVTGANKGIGFEVCRQLATQGITVVLTARNEKRGLEAVEKLKASSLSGSIIFHQLDVTDLASIASLAEFIKSQFGKLDILVNNAGIGGVTVDSNAIRAVAGAAGETGAGVNWTEVVIQTYDSAAECFQTNYYGAKRTAEALLPLLQLSDSPRIVNVSSLLGKLKNLPNVWAKGVLSDVENLTEERIDQVLNEFLKDFKEGCLEAKGWSGAYMVSKAAMNAYTRILAKKYPSFQINSVCPGYVKTDINFNTGYLTVEEGAESLVRLAVLPDDGPSGLFFDRKEVSSVDESSSMAETPKRYAVVTGSNKGIGFEVCRQLAAQGITVVLTARDEKRGLEAVEKLKASSLSGSVIFHQLDVADSATVATLAEFIKSQFGKLDILVNNAGVSGITVDRESLKASPGAASETGGSKTNLSEIKMIQTYDLAAECLQINYYGAKRTTEALLPLLQLSDSPRIVNVTSSLGKLENIPDEWVKGVLSDAENLTEDKIDQLLNEFLKDFKEGSLEAKGWPKYNGAYIISKAALNAYTRILAKKYPSFRINSVCPGYVNTDINFNTGHMTVEEAAEGLVKLALLADDGPSGCFFERKEVSSF
ncbi:uncharacterized protein LOC105174332 [Sesamum indicum]|uniref:Uncharacterized protein LOC105174332 n=1 Tax=Sesamum indicum TaxID=4182 RepID=A0A8M8V2K4_SESIN|nr:uncharacterized protein LOC105174332 [Sesamum indicum]